MLITRRGTTASASDRAIPLIALPPFRLKLCARRTEQIAAPQIVGVAVNEGEPASQSFADSSEAISITLRAYPTNSVFSACLIFVLDKIQSLDHAPESSLELDNCSRTTIRHNNKPRPSCKRTRERYRRNRHNRSCSCPIPVRWSAESGHAS